MSALLSFLLLFSLCYGLNASTLEPPMEKSLSFSEEQSLLALKASWDDPRGLLAGWNASLGLPYCSWRGVMCGRNFSAVIGLNLSSLRLGGTLSPSIGLFPHLDTLLLAANGMSGPIPPEIGKLSRLITLDLSHNAFSGELPSQTLANLTSLVTLNLAFNQLSGRIPNEFGSLLFLKTLQLRHNSFNGSIPGSLFEAISLKFLLLESNTLSGEIPSTIANLLNLRYLAVEYNSLTGSIPPSITNLTKISAIYGGYNKLSGIIPPLIGNLKRLLYLDLQQNLLTGDIPPTIGSLIELEELELNNNQLSGALPTQLGQLHKVTILDLSYNHFNGSIPAELSNMSSLQTLYLQQNNLSGSITPSLGNLTMLKSLNLSNNNLSGEVPTNGILANFSASSFVGNGLLCGPPLNLTCISPPPATPTAPPTSTGGSRNSSQGPSKLSKKWKIVIGGVVGAVGLSSIIAFLVFFSRKTRPKEIVQRENRFSPDLSDNVSKAKLEMYIRGFKYSYEEIVSHAGYYDTAHVVGKGRFATMYRSDFPGGTQLAVKVFKNPISQAAFEREVEGLESAAQFNTLLPIRGYFSNPVEKVIFYDFMPKGTLYDLLHNNSDAPALLDWSKTFTIALGIAQALNHLHRGSNFRILHKDLKSTNVLLDENLYPLVADYGLIGLVSKSSVETTPGYTAPELRSSKKYTEKTDVYSFGVVLLELLTVKKPVSYISDRELNLVTWVLRLQKDGRGKEVFSMPLVESCPFPEYPDRALNLAILCLSDQPAQRPTTSEIASVLEGLGGNNSPLRSPGLRQDKPLLLSGSV